MIELATCRKELIKMSDEDYFKSDGLSNSFLINFDRAPAYAFCEKEETSAMAFGSMLHEYILQPEDFICHYTSMIRPTPETNKTHKVYKDEAAKYPDKKVLFQDEIDDLDKVKSNIVIYRFENDFLGNFLRQSKKEIAIYFEYLNQQCRGKIDLLYQNGLDEFIIFDLKKTQNCLEFQKSVNNYKYYRQAFFYRYAVAQIMGIPIENVRFVFIAVEEKAPHGVLSFELSEDYYTLGEKETMISIDKYLEWKERNGSKDELYVNETHKLMKPDWLGRTA